jgi:hypothetical protein
MRFDVLPDVVAIFHASVHITVGDGASILFWVDAWIDGQTAGAIAPDLVEMVCPASGVPAQYNKASPMPRGFGTSRGSYP